VRERGSNRDRSRASPLDSRLPVPCALSFRAGDRTSSRFQGTRVGGRRDARRQAIRPWGVHWQDARAPRAFHEAAKKYAGKIKLVAVAVSVNQSPERVKLYAEKYHMPMEIYYDRKGNAADVFDAAATSYIVVLDKSGTVVYTGLGGSQNIDAAIRKGIGG
jgi:hypothetical protein